MIYLQDADFTLYVGDALETLRTLPAGSVNCCVTSPPYWGLRDYGTGAREGGDPSCDHIGGERFSSKSGLRDTAAPRVQSENIGKQTPFRSVCGKCGARRVDQQLGLEATPDLYVQNMVAVFQEVRRVLADEGTLWLNLGDSYGSGTTADRNPTSITGPEVPASWSNRSQPQRNGLKPKDLVGIPWRVAFALQTDGWYLRSDIVWAKPNPMPESVTDRPTKAHEYVFLLSKQPRYWFDQEAVRERVTGNAHARGNGVNPKALMNAPGVGVKQNASFSGAINKLVTSRNVRSVWEIATQPYPEAHFATFPEELARRCILAGCPEWVCGTCGKPRERIVEVESSWRSRAENGAIRDNLAPEGLVGAGTQRAVHGAGVSHNLDSRRREIKGWSDCDHGNYRPGVVLDPFLGSGTVALVARKHGRACVGIELNPAYAELAARRTSQLSLLT